MGISQYIKEIGRGKDGARPLSREQAADLLGQVLDGSACDLEVGAFCLAMRIKGETPEEMAGCLDATHQRLQHVPLHSSGVPTVVLPSYNGARKLPVLTPLLALLLARGGVAVLVHGTPTESSRVFSSEVLLALDIPARTAIKSIAPGEVAFVPTGVLCPALKRLLDVRRAVGLRNLQQLALTVDEGFHLRHAARIGHHFALGATQQQGVGLDQLKSARHRDRVLRVRVAADHQAFANARVHDLDQAVGRVAQAHCAAYIEQAFERRAQHAGRHKRHLTRRY